MASLQDLYAARIQTEYTATVNSMGGIGQQNYLYWQLKEGATTLAETSEGAVGGTRTPVFNADFTAGTAVGSPAPGQAGPFADGSSKSVLIDASGTREGYITSTTLQGIGDTCVAIDLWLKVSRLPPAGQFAELTGWIGSLLLYDTGALRYISSAFTSLSSTLITDANWHYVSLQREGNGTGKIHLYVDGVLDATDPLGTQSLATPINTTFIGYPDVGQNRDAAYYLSNVAWYVDCPLPPFNYPVPVSTTNQLPYLHVGP